MKHTKSFLKSIWILQFLSNTLTKSVTLQKNYIKIVRQRTYSTQQRLSCPEKYIIMKAKFQYMLELSLCPSKSPWSLPLYIMPKPDVTAWSQCRDFHHLNVASIADRWLIPHIHDFPMSLQGAHIFTQVDLINAFYQIPEAEEDIPKTTLFWFICVSIQSM